MGDNLRTIFKHTVSRVADANPSFLGDNPERRAGGGEKQRRPNSPSGKSNYLTPQTDVLYIKTEPRDSPNTARPAKTDTAPPAA